MNTQMEILVEKARKFNASLKPPSVETTQELLCMPADAEVKHSLIIGSPGTGKTVLLNHVIEHLRSKGAKAIINAVKGDEVAKFFDPEHDLLFNPTDARCAGWSIFNEIETYMDIDAVATSLIPPGGGSQDPYWENAARDVFASLLYYCWQTGQTSNADIWRHVSVPADDIARWFSNTPGCERGSRQISGPNNRADSVLSVMAVYTKSFEVMQRADGVFKIMDWLSKPDGGFIFVTSMAEIKETLRPILSLLIDLLGRRLLSMPDDLNRQIYFVLDEFANLHRLPTIVDLLTRSRSKGGRVYLAIQDVGQVEKIYGREHRQSILSACGNTIIYRVADPDTARHLSERIGDTKYSTVEESHSQGNTDMKDGITHARREKTEKLVLPSDIQNLPDLSCYLKFVNHDWTRVQLQYRGYPDKCPPFVLRDGFALEDIAKLHAETVSLVSQAEKIRQQEPVKISSLAFE